MTKRAKGNRGDHSNRRADCQVGLRVRIINSVKTRGRGATLTFIVAKEGMGGLVRLAKAMVGKQVRPRRSS